MKVGMLVISDGGITRGKHYVALNDINAIKYLYKQIGYQTQILFNEDINNLNSSTISEYDTLFVFYTGVINFGGKQSRWVQKIINLINIYDKEVVIFSNDVLDKINNKARDSFVRIERPVYFASPDGVGGGKKNTVDLDIIDDFEINQSFMIGKTLSKLEDVSTKPSYDLVYGGRDRPELTRKLKKIIKTHNILLYGTIQKKMPKIDGIHSDMFFDNAELRVINSFGRYTLMLHEKKKPYFTSRVFEQLFSNSIVLFDRNYSILSNFWNNENTFDDLSDLDDLISTKVTQKLIDEQHEVARSFDYDKYINYQVESLAKILKC